MDIRPLTPEVDSFADFEKEEGNHLDKSETESSLNSTNNLVEQDEEEIMDKSNANNNSLMEDLIGQIEEEIISMQQDDVQRGLTKPSVIALGVVLLPAVLVIMSPVLIGLTIVLVPTFFFGFIFFAIPSFCMAPFVLFLIYIFGGMPKLYSMINHLFNKIFGGGDNQIEENNNEDENDIPGTSQSN
ncbi:hypothetical protein ACQ4LE_001509 [Meloidogyne hapla]|uniref:Oleosin n=1 Tax=Meloidogyne hapla TaxID=6305 RepID=A0A1I8BGC4_MELHA